MDYRYKLPKGFFDYIGDDGNKQYNVLKHFFETGLSYGFEFASLSDIGCSDSYMNFGSAAIGRSYKFDINKDYSLMLASDSLASTVRAYSANGSYTNKRIMSNTAVFRHRKKKFRRWHHMIYTMFNENDELNASVTNILLTNQFLTQYYPKLIYNHSLYGLFDTAAEHFNISNVNMKKHIYNYYNGEHKQDYIYDFIADIEAIGLSSKDFTEAFSKINYKYPFESDTLKKYTKYFSIIEKEKINYEIIWDGYRAIEYSSGICYLVKNVLSDKTIADGGSYKNFINQYNPNIRNCYSAAFSLEDIFTQEKNLNETIFLIKLDCTFDFFLKCQNKLRKMGYKIHEINKNNKSLKSILNSLPSNSNLIILGYLEETTKSFKLNNEIISIERDSEI